MKIGIIGAGMIGGTLARRFIAVGHEVFLANSRGPETLARLAAETHAHAVTAFEAARAGEVVVVTIPLVRVRDLRKDLFAGVPDGVVVVDACVHEGERLEPATPGEGRGDRLQPHSRILRRRALVHDQIRVDRLEHQPLGGGHLAQTGQITPRKNAQVRVRQEAPLERPLAHPHHVRSEVRKPVLREARRHLRVDLGLLAREHQQFFDVVARDRAVKQL